MTRLVTLACLSVPLFMLTGCPDSGGGITDADSDGYSADNGDCDDSDASVYPEAPEVWYDGIDQNCDGASDYDQDGDGYESDGHGGDDCDDTIADVHPEATERFDFRDTDCDGIGDQLNLSDADSRFSGPLSNSMAGYAVATAGDVNNDGYSDVLVSSPAFMWGQANLLLGSSSGISNMSLADADVILTDDEFHSSTHMSLATAGDVNGDGYSDILIGAPGVDSPTTDAGAAYVVFGAASTLVDISLSDANAKLSGEIEEARAGYSVSTAGDVDGDGFSDILVGAPHARLGEDYVGNAYLVLGAPMGIHGGSLSNADLKLTGEAAGDLAGFSVSTAGDVNGDGFSDIIVGAPFLDKAYDEQFGAAYLIYGL